MIIDTIKGIINDVIYTKLENLIPYVIKNLVIDIICIIHANPVRINNNMMNMPSNCFIKYLLIIFILLKYKAQNLNRQETYYK